MRRLFLALCALTLAAAPLAAAEPSAAGVLRETWYEVRADKGKLGHLHFRAVAEERNGQKLVRTRVRERWSYIRSGDPYTETVEQETLETPSGQVVECNYTSNLSKKQQLRMHGKAAGRELTFHVLGDDGKGTDYSQKIPWDPDALGLYVQDCFFQNKSLTPGQVLRLKAFHTSVNRVVPVSFTVKGPEQTKAAGRDRRLLRVEQSYPKELYLDKATLWLDETGLIVKMETDTPDFGLVTHQLTTEEVATAPFEAKVTDVESPVLVNKPINFKAGAPKELVVRVTREGDDDPGTLLADEERQRVLKADQAAVELRLLAQPPRPAGAASAQGRAAAEYLESNFFIRSDDALVRKHARDAVGTETDPRRQVRAIRRWMKEHFNGNYEVAFATADETARTLEGDCSEMGILGAAMCRALGIPSRVVFGLVYDPANPGFGGHLWAEVFLDGRWELFDPTGVIPQLGAAYLKIRDYSLKDVLNPDELVEVRRAFAGKMKVEILDVK